MWCHALRLPPDQSEMQYIHVHTKFVAIVWNHKPALNMHTRGHFSSACYCASGHLTSQDAFHFTNQDTFLTYRSCPAVSQSCSFILYPQTDLIGWINHVISHVIIMIQLLWKTMWLQSKCHMTTKKGHVINSTSYRLHREREEWCSDGRTNSTWESVSNMS